MSIPTRRYRIGAFMTIAAAAASLILSATPASAEVAAQSPDQPVNIWSCPNRIDTVAEALRDEGFTAQAARNIAFLARRECLAGN
jgi:hypothetical protein